LAAASWSTTSDFSTPLTVADGVQVEVAHSNNVGIFLDPEIAADPGYLLPNEERDYTHPGM
jgi:hypothetical protein